MRLDLAKLIGVVIAALIIAAITGLTAGYIRQSERLAALEKEYAAGDTRLTNLENGRMTPMSSESRARFEAIDQRLNRQFGEITGELNALHRQHEELLRLHMVPQEQRK